MEVTQQSGGTVPRPAFTLGAMIMLTIIFVSSFTYRTYDLSRDIDSVQDRAQVAADREDMLRYVTQLRQNMEERDMTHGHAALIFKTPTNDLALQYKSVIRIEQRLHSIAGLDKSTTTYQVAMSDIRGTLRELPKLATNYTWAHYGWWMGIFVLVLWIGQVLYFVWYDRMYW